MSSLLKRKLTLCQALTFVLLLVAPLCLLSPQSSWVSAWHPSSEASSGRPARARRQLHFRNEWAPWSGWSVCSRSCGGGASVRTRTCITRNPVGGPCSGEARQYKICNTKEGVKKCVCVCLCVCVCVCVCACARVCVCVQECPPSSEDFREMQCAAFNNRPIVAGTSFRWTTFHGGSNPCELSCLALGHRFYYNFGRVLDGTACAKEPGAVCVNGRCLTPGCDSILGSKQQEDACMVCGGQNTTCMHHKSVYQSNGLEAGSPLRVASSHSSLCFPKEVDLMEGGCTKSLLTRSNTDGLELPAACGPFGYNEVTMIPAGATHIRVTDNSRNYLALQNGHSQFVINGNWKISIPGEYNVAGTKLVYRRSADTWESFEVPGPTQEDLHLMVLATDRNPGIEYDFKTFEATSPISPPQPSPAPPPAHLPRLQREENHRNLLPQPSPGRHCGKCHRIKGRRERQRQYCQKDFVFRARVLGKLYRGQETRYDVQILHTYRNGFRLEHREFLWVPNVCDCPHLEEGKQYILMVRRHINHEETLNRILLEEESYVVPYRPREEELLRPLERLCNNRGAKHPAERTG
ncbi:ADAMTS-like protein 5 [Dissostichus eleginoides]|uniref:ADAMTS-like protein 5 n=1 Tax=Dissostichus eleginoides TaxID=100907 RepID=A0AAD9BVL5_DISEL|nr:ADAMTS-like protein 5 [Dissostichus eleginoides]